MGAKTCRCCSGEDAGAEPLELDTATFEVSAASSFQGIVEEQVVEVVPKSTEKDSARPAAEEEGQPLADGQEKLALLHATLDPGPSGRRGACREFVREALVQVLTPCMAAPKGWRLGDTFHHLMECKQAICGASKASRKSALEFLFSDTKSPHTHRQCVINMHDRNFEISSQDLRLSKEDFQRLREDWATGTRPQAVAQGIRFRPGTSLQHVLVGPHKEEAGETHSLATDVHMHFLNPSNPELHTSVFKFFRLFFQASHKALHWLGADAGEALLSALSSQLPETSRTLQDVVQGNRYEITESVPGVLCHRWSCQWNLKAIRRRFGENQYHLFRDRPMYDFRLEESNSQRLALRLQEMEGHRLEITFFVAKSGKLVWGDAKGRPWVKNGSAQEVPSFWDTSFKARVIDIHLPLRCCGCFGTASFPPLSFDVTASREPHPTFRVSCSEMGHFPMEWFYSPLFDVTHMRTLLVRHLEVECRFEGDEVHLSVHFQMPKFSSVLRRVMKAFSNKILDVIFGAAHEDPPPVVLAALGDDLKSLESQLA